MSYLGPQGAPNRISTPRLRYQRQSQQPRDMVDAEGRPCSEADSSLIAIEWPVRKDDPNRAAGPSTWGMRYCVGAWMLLSRTT